MCILQLIFLIKHVNTIIPSFAALSTRFAVLSIWFSFYKLRKSELAGIWEYHSIVQIKKWRQPWQGDLWSSQWVSREDKTGKKGPWFPEWGLTLRHNPCEDSPFLNGAVQCVHAQSCQTLQPSGLLCPWDFTGRNTGVGYHFLLRGSF